MSDEQRIPEAERLEGVVRRVIADVLAHGRAYRMNPDAHACRVYDHRMRCAECGRDASLPSSVITVFAGSMGHWWMNGTAGGKATDYVPANTVLPVLRAYLAQNAELRKLRAEREGDRSLQAEENEPAPYELKDSRAVADAVWAVAKRLGVSDVARRLKGLSSRLHELATEQAPR